jgi:hypothetical protein
VPDAGSSMGASTRIAQAMKAAESSTVQMNSENTRSGHTRTFLLLSRASRGGSPRSRRMSFTLACRSARYRQPMIEKIMITMGMLSPLLMISLKS